MVAAEANWNEGAQGLLCPEVAAFLDFPQADRRGGNQNLICRPEGAVSVAYSGLDRDQG